MNTSQKDPHSAHTNVNQKHLRSTITLEHTLAMLTPHAAGLDVASEEQWGWVPEDRAADNVRRVGAFTCDLSAIAEWVKPCEVTTVARESTGVSWIPLFQVLEEKGVTVSLVNARELNKVSGRPKTDRLDGPWIQRLHSSGVLSASFRPERNISPLRARLRHRDTGIRQSAQPIQPRQKALHQMHLLFEKVIEEITGVTGMTILQAL